MPLYWKCPWSIRTRVGFKSISNKEIKLSVSSSFSLYAESSVLTVDVDGLVLSLNSLLTINKTDG